MDQRRNDLLNYLVSQLFKYDFLRKDLRYAQAHGFDSYQDFVQTQRNFIQGFDEQRIQTLEFIRDQLLPVSQVLITDSADFVSPMGFYLSKQGQVIFVVDMP